MQQPLRVVCGVIFRDGLLLAAQRPAGKTHAYAWELPGGKVKTGESDAEALVRELQEELSITVTVERALAPVVHMYTWGTVQLLPFVCSTQDEPKCIEHAALRWLAPDDWFSVNWLEADLPIVSAL
ncbi:MAG: (deoxy)nucleoside triphosphate pyrophosphohydrolase [Leptolyngbya sp. SIO3F4]|nr:(deoxy)nucleoside triphosphate pyrophosphohydrolase [Leptolyngbya sp. SIO3F4]